MNMRHAASVVALEGMMIEFGHGTHVGLCRRRNEDTYYADPALGLFLVADGMGGHQHGEVAAALARDKVTEQVRFGWNLVDAVRHAAAELHQHVQQSPSSLPMGATIAALHLSATTYEMAWVGDSRIYRWHNGALKQVNHDQSLVQELVSSGRLEPAQASQLPQRNVVTQALGITAIKHLHTGMARGQLFPLMRFLICSDGLTEQLGDQDISRIIARDELSAQECVDHLLLAALSDGGKDNITAIVVRQY